MKSCGALLFTGEIIDSLQCVRLLKKRSASEIWYATGRYDSRESVLKFVGNAHPGIDRFIAGAHLWRELSHTNLLCIRGIGSCAGGVYAETEYCSTGSLRSMLERKGRLNLEESVGILCDILSALTLLHERGAVHRDIKPENILFDENNNLKLADWDIMKLPDQTETPGKILGSASYLSPEQARNSQNVTDKSDIYALSTLFYEMISGEKRFGKGSFVELASRISNTRERLSTSLLEYVPEKLFAILNSCVEYNATFRPSASELLETIKKMGLFANP